MVRPYLRAGVYNIPLLTQVVTPDPGNGGGTTPDPGNLNGFDTVWGQRTQSSSAISLNGASNQTISGKSFKNLNATAILLQNCTNITITQCDFSTVNVVLYALNCTNIRITYCRAYNMTGPGTTNNGNFVQFNNVTNGYIGHNIAVDGNTEDMISLYQSHGQSGNPIVVEYNQLANSTYTSTSGSGMMTGDSGGTWQTIRNNVIDSAGQVGIGIANGQYIIVDSNSVYGAQTSRSNVGIYAANYGGGTMANNQITNNNINWKNAQGQNNPLYIDSSGGVTNSNGNTFNTLAKPSIALTNAAL